MRELLNAVSRYFICSLAGKCFQRILIKFFKENSIIVQKFRYLCRSRKSRSRIRYSISSDFREKQRDLRSLYFRLLRRSGLQYSENRPRDSKFEYAQARGIRPVQDQTCFRIAWRLRTNIFCVREVSAIIFLDILKTDSVRHAGEVLKTMRSTIESTSNQRQCLKSLEISKEEFYVFRRIKPESS